MQKLTTCFQKANFLHLHCKFQLNQRKVLVRVGSSGRYQRVRLQWDDIMVKYKQGWAFAFFLGWPIKRFSYLAFLSSNSRLTHRNTESISLNFAA